MMQMGQPNLVVLELKDKNEIKEFNYCIDIHVNQMGSLVQIVGPRRRRRLCPQNLESRHSSQNLLIRSLFMLPQQPEIA